MGASEWGMVYGLFSAEGEVVYEAVAGGVAG